MWSQLANFNSCYTRPQSNGVVIAINKIFALSQHAQYLVIHTISFCLEENTESYELYFVIWYQIYLSSA